MDISKTLEERESTHGDFRAQAELACKLKNAVKPYGFTATQAEALNMIMTKVARICEGNSNEPDHWRDIVGYATLVVRELENSHT